MKLRVSGRAWLEDLVHDVDRAQLARFEFESARRRVRYRLENPLIPFKRPGGLARVISPQRAATVDPAFGWRRVRIPSRDAYLELPLWLYWWRELLALRYRAIALGIRAGLLELEEGGYYRDARPRCPSWLWCFLQDADTDSRQPAT